MSDSKKLIGSTIQLITKTNVRRLLSILARNDNFWMM